MIPDLEQRWGMSIFQSIPISLFCVALVINSQAVAEELFLRCEIEKMQLKKEGRFVDGNGKTDSFTLIRKDDDIIDIIPELDCNKSERFFRANSTKVYFSCEHGQFSISYIINRIDGEYFSLQKFSNDREVAYFGKCKKGERQF